MMRSPRGIAIAVRRPDKSIALRESDWKPMLASPAWKLPLLRGVATMVDAMHAGYAALGWSGEQQLTEDEKAQVQESRLGRLVYVVPALFALGLFVAAPQGLTYLAGRYLGLGSSDLLDPRFHAATAGAKLLILLSYLLLISRFRDIQRFFQYHGAEHKVISTHEAGLELTVENARAQTTLHPRCGTTFLVVVVLISAIVFAVVLPFVMPFMPRFEGLLGHVFAFLIKLPLLPVIAAVAYELQRISARYCTTGPLRALLWPGFLVQKITTREPTDDQLEIALVALRAAIWRQHAVGELPRGDESPIVYASFDEFAQNAHAVRPPPALAA